jgi:REP element-mobilizing transposase RayT
MRPRTRKKLAQLALDLAPRRTGPGGPRAGAGRPRGRNVAHGPRPFLKRREPQHVTLRLADGVPSIRRDTTHEVIKRAIRAKSGGDAFRVVHFHILSNHVHLLVEATTKQVLGNSMQGLNVRIARNCNKRLGRRGRFFRERYHVRALVTPTEVRSCLRYVLLNSDMHLLRAGARYLTYACDRYSSAAWFEDWDDERWRYYRDTGPPGIARPRTWLLRDGWKRAGGPISFS